MDRIHAQFPQDFDLGRVIHALDDDFDVRHMAEFDDEADDVARLLVLDDEIGEGLIDLDRVEGNLAEVIDTRIADAEVIHQDADA